MKKMILVLAVLLMTAPAMAGVVVEATGSGSEVTIPYYDNGAEDIEHISVCLFNYYRHNIEQARNRYHTRINNHNQRQ